MTKLPKIRWILLAIVANGLASPSLAAEGRHTIKAVVDTSFVYAESPLSSWLEGSLGKLRFDEKHDGLKLSRAFIDYKGRITPTITARATLNYTSEQRHALDFTEAYLQFRPVPKNNHRIRVRLGAFYPHLSMENVDDGWSTPYTLSSSAVNTWIAEEIRVMGAEASMSKDVDFLGSRQRFGLVAAAFYGNDPAGALVAWKGWSLHDRQTTYGDRLPLPPLPSLTPTGVFSAQALYHEPLREIDHRPGYYFGANWRQAKRIRLQYMHYDNRADPEVLRGGQYGWKTEFDHLGVQIQLPWKIGLIGQALDGRTQMGGFLGATRAVDVGFDAQFVLVTRAFDRHRLSARYDNFDLDQRDSTPEDNNFDEGHALTFAYMYEHSAKLRLGIEWLQIHTVNHLGWMYQGLPANARERSVQVTLRWRFGEPRTRT